MDGNILQRFFQHNLWANLQILEACSNLKDEELDAIPQSVTKGTIRETLIHIAEAEDDYLADLTRVPSTIDWETPPTFEELRQYLTTSGEGFITLAGSEPDELLESEIHADDGYIIQPWVLLLQAVNHATEHREQIKSMLNALGIKPPRIDTWAYGRLEKAVIPPAQP